MELRILLLVLLGILLHALALAADSDSQWKRLESLQDLDKHEFTLCLALVPWCGESRSFMRDFVDLVKRENVQLQLRYVNVHRDKTLLGSQKSLTLFRFREAFNYTGKLSAGHVFASVKHAVSASPDFPFHRLHSVADLHEFVGSTDRSLVLLDLCGWTERRDRRDRMVEDYENDEVGLTATSQLKWLYGNANSSSDLCTPSAERDFDVFFHNLSEFANANSLTLYRRRFGIVTSLQVLQDANIEVPTSNPWVLMAQSQDIAPSWRISTDAGQLQVFLANSTVLVDEVNRDTELRNDRPSVLLFINRGSHLSEVRAESMRALQVVRDVARYYANQNPSNDGQDNDSTVSADSEEFLSTFSDSFAGGKNGQILAIREKDLSQGLTGILSNPAEAILQVLLQHGNKKRNEDDPQQDSEDGVLLGTSTADFLEKPTFSVNYQVRSPGEQDISQAGSEQLPQEDSKSFNFAFFEGADAVQELFTGEGKGKPLAVVVFPERDSYYTYMKNRMTFSSLVKFLDGALSGTVQPTLRSGPMPVTPRQPVRPPFVNLDFHQVNSVPHVTAETFSEFVLGNRSLISMDNSGNSLGGAWNKNSLVVFTLPWCGFCKRMELAVYEVHRCYTGYYSPRNWSLTDLPEFKGAGFEALDIYQMDCSSNECSHILKNIFEEERFPSVVLFPARQKTSPVVYRGAPSVKDVLHFIANFGTSTSFRVSEGLQKTQPSSIRIEEHEASETEPHKVRLSDQATEELQVIPLRIGVGQILLASDKFSNASSILERSAILIISVTMDHIMGVIVNKRMQWEQLTSLDDHVRESLQDAFLGYGGPVYEHPKHLFALTRLEGIEDFWKISSSLYIGGPSATEKVMEQIGADKMQASEFAFVLGYCGWSLLQLQQELTAGYWLVTQYREDLFPWSFSAPAFRHDSPSQ